MPVSLGDKPSRPAGEPVLKRSVNPVVAVAAIAVLALVVVGIVAGGKAILREPPPVAKEMPVAVMGEEVPVPAEPETPKTEDPMQQELREMEIRRIQDEAGAAAGEATR